MSESAIRTEIFNILNGVSNIGKVYDYERWAVDWGTFLNLYKDSGGKILGWEIGRKAPITEDETSVKKHTYLIKGYMGLKDTNMTEKTFNGLIESVAAAFRSNKELNGSVLGHDYIQVEVLDVRTFGSVLCHFTELTLTVYEHIG